QSADGILGLDMGLRYDASRIHLLGVTQTGIGSAMTVVTNNQAGTCPVVLFGSSALQGSGSFLKVTYTMTTAVDGVPFSVSAVANEGQIPITRSPALTGGAGSMLHPGGLLEQ